MERISGNSGRTSHKRLTAFVLFSMLVMTSLAVDTSCTAPPNCSVGEHAARMPSHQGHMWQCVPNGQQS